jgi:predicted NAD/FAD-dependent oxidoreductase
MHGLGGRMATRVVHGGEHLVFDHRHLPFDDSSADFVFAGRALDTAKRLSDRAA